MSHPSHRTSASPLMDGDGGQPPKQPDAHAQRHPPPVQLPKPRSHSQSRPPPSHPNLNLQSPPPPPAHRLHHSQSTPHILAPPLGQLPLRQHQHQHQHQALQLQTQTTAFPPRSQSFHASKSRTYSNVAPSSPASPTSSASPSTPLDPARRYFSHHYGQSTGSTPRFVDRQAVSQNEKHAAALHHQPPNPPPHGHQFPPRHSSQVAVPPESWSLNQSYRPGGASARSSSFSHSR
ncbi:hypothetical protein BROUX41_006364 [Berkeleyomyces rouxiae]